MLCRTYICDMISPYNTPQWKKKRFDNPAVMYIDFYLRMYYMYFIAIQIILPSYLVELIYSKLYQFNLHNQMLSDSYLNFLSSFNMILLVNVDPKWNELYWRLIWNQFVHHYNNVDVILTISCLSITQILVETLAKYL